MFSSVDMTHMPAWKSFPGIYDVIVIDFPRFAQVDRSVLKDCIDSKFGTDTGVIGLASNRAALTDSCS